MKEQREHVLGALYSEMGNGRQLLVALGLVFLRPALFLLGWNLFAETVFDWAPELGYWQCFGLNMMLITLRKYSTSELHLTHRSLY